MENNKQFFVKYLLNRVVKIETHVDKRFKREFPLNDVADLIGAIKLALPSKLGAIDLDELTLHLPHGVTRTALSQDCFAASDSTGTTLDPGCPLSALKSIGSNSKQPLIIKSNNNSQGDFSSNTTSDASGFSINIKIAGIPFGTESLKRNALVRKRMDSVDADALRTFHQSPPLLYPEAAKENSSCLYRLSVGDRPETEEIRDYFFVDYTYELEKRLLLCIRVSTSLEFELEISTDGMKAELVERCLLDKVETNDPSFLSNLEFKALMKFKDLVNRPISRKRQIPLPFKVKTEFESGVFNTSNGRKVTPLFHVFRLVVDEESSRRVKKPRHSVF